MSFADLEDALFTVGEASGALKLALPDRRMSTSCETGRRPPALHACLCCWPSL